MGVVVGDLPGSSSLPRVGAGRRTTVYALAVSFPHGLWRLARHLQVWITVESDAAAFPYVRGRGMGYLDDVLDWAEETNLRVVLDLHAAPGSQSGEQQSGYLSHDWTQDDWDADKSLEAIEVVAERYGNRSCVIAVDGS